MTQDATEVNPTNPKKHISDSVFSLNEPIPADLPRRQFDRKLLESYDADHERIRNISSRQTRIEVVLETVQKDLQRLEEQQGTMLGHFENTATAMQAISSKLTIHTGMEEYQWTVVNKANETLAAIGSALNDHLQCAGAISTRIDWVERLLFLLYGGIGTIAGIFVTQYLSRA